MALVVKNLPANAGDVRDAGSVPGSGESPGGENSHPLQYSCLENPTDRRARRATVYGVAKSRTRLERLSTRVHACSLSLGLPVHKAGMGHQQSSSTAFVGRGVHIRGPRWRWQPVVIVPEGGCTTPGGEALENGNPPGGRKADVGSAEPSIGKDQVRDTHARAHTHTHSLGGLPGGDIKPARLLHCQWAASEPTFMSELYSSDLSLPSELGTHEV